MRPYSLRRETLPVVMNDYDDDDDGDTISRFAAVPVPAGDIDQINLFTKLSSARLIYTQ